MSAGDSVYLPSKYWQGLVRINAEQLDARGFENFKRTVATNYFTWTHGSDFRSHLLSLARRAPLSEWPGLLRGLDWRGVSPTLDRRHSLILSIFTRLVWSHARRHDPLKLLDALEEPEIGNPFQIYMNGRLISQDLANSVLEFYSSTEESTGVREVCELGAGYGRLAYVFLNALPCRYTIIDIPPALCVSERYLSEVFPGKKVFSFREFRAYEEVREEFEASDIRFLLPHQAEMLPDNSVDLFLNISSLHEMTREQVSAYFRMIGRLTRGRFYTKQWMEGRNGADKVWLRPGDYPVPVTWRELYMRPAEVQTNFFEALYDVGCD
jgi:putative sugar O-methyltransferase